MHKMKPQTAPTIFQNKFRKPIHNYPTNFSASSYNIPAFKLVSLNTEFQPRPPHNEKTLPLKFLKKCKKM